MLDLGCTLLLARQFTLLLARYSRYFTLFLARYFTLFLARYSACYGEPDQLKCPHCRKKHKFCQ